MAYLIMPSPAGGRLRLPSLFPIAICGVPGLLEYFLYSTFSALLIKKRQNGHITPLKETLDKTGAAQVEFRAGRE